MISAQGGDIEEFRRSLSSGEIHARHVIEVRARKRGVVRKCDARAFGEAIRLLGGGRLAREDRIDPKVSCEVIKKTGDPVSRDDLLAKVYCGKEDHNCENAADMIERAYSIGEMTERTGLVIGSVGPVHSR